MSQMMGCNSYADFMVETSLAKSPKVVTSFLQELSETVKPKADQVSSGIFCMIYSRHVKIIVSK